MGNWLGRLVAWLRRLFGRPEVPGRFESGKRFAWGGRLASAPFLWPSREYLVYVPRNHVRWQRAPLLVLCHGCRQTPEDIARGTRIAALADERGMVVLLPRQSEDANPWRCWTWFDSRTAGGGGEAAIVAAQMKTGYVYPRLVGAGCAPPVVNFLKEAANDPQVVAIKRHRQRAGQRRCISLQDAAGCGPDRAVADPRRRRATSP